MNSSPSIVNIAPALIKFKSEMCLIGKGATAKFSGRSYTWAKLEHIIEDINSLLARYDLTIIQPTAINGIDVQKTILLHTSGEWISSEISLKQSDWVINDWQELGKCFTYARRYSILALLGMGQIDDPDDDDGASQAKKSKEIHQSPQISDDKFQILVDEILKVDESLRTKIKMDIIGRNKLSVLRDIKEHQFEGALRYIRSKQ